MEVYHKPISMGYVITQIITACWVSVAKSPTNYLSKVKHTWKMLLMLTPILNGDISQVSISMQSTNIIFPPLAKQWALFLDYKSFSKLQIIQKKNYLRFLIFLIWCPPAVSRPTIRSSEKTKIQNAKLLRGFIHKSANIWGKKILKLRFFMLYQIKIQFSKQSMTK